VPFSERRGFLKTMGQVSYCACAFASTSERCQHPSTRKNESLNNALSQRQCPPAGLVLAAAPFDTKRQLQSLASCTYNSQELLLCIAISCCSNASPRASTQPFQLVQHDSCASASEFFWKVEYASSFGPCDESDNNHKTSLSHIAS